MRERGVLRVWHGDRYLNVQKWSYYRNQKGDESYELGNGFARGSKERRSCPVY